MSSPTAFSWRGLLQSLFEEPDDAFGSVASPLASAHTPRWSGRSASSRSPSASSASFAAGDTDDNASQPYAPSRLDGEFNVWFARKPLGLGLVPATQLYGTWEISSIAPASNLPGEARVSRDEVAERGKIQRGDVVIAVNFNTRVAKLPRDAFASYLQQSTCPVVVTLRRPALYGAFDSRALSTAMFPASIEYRGRDTDLDHKKFLARASSKQWKHSLQHELSQKPTHRTTKSKATRDTRPHGLALEPTPEVDPSSASPSSVASSPSDVAAHADDDETDRPRNLSTADLTPMGEFTATFHDAPLDLVLAPSTRLYGSVEVYDPKHFGPLIEIGDVITAVNNDASVAKWPTDDAVDHIGSLLPPITITFRRPAAYRKYLEMYFKSSRAKVSSRSTATAMFPDSAEYKHGHYQRGKKTM